MLKEAHKAYEQAIAIEPDFAAAWQGLGGCNEKQRNLAEAEKCYRKAASLNPKSYDAVLCIGDILRQQGKFADAKKFFLKAKSMPDSAKNPGEVDKFLKLNDLRKKEVAN